MQPRELLRFSVSASSGPATKGAALFGACQRRLSLHASHFQTMHYLHLETPRHPSIKTFCEPLDHLERPGAPLRSLAKKTTPSILSRDPSAMFSRRADSSGKAVIEL